MGGKFGQRVENAFSVRPWCALCLCGEFLGEFSTAERTHHGSTEYTEDAHTEKRKKLLAKSKPIALRTAVVSEHCCSQQS